MCNKGAGRDSQLPGNGVFSQEAGIAHEMLSFHKDHKVLRGMVGSPWGELVRMGSPGGCSAFGKRVLEVPAPEEGGQRVPGQGSAAAAPRGYGTAMDLALGAGTGSSPGSCGSLFCAL